MPEMSLDFPTKDEIRQKTASLTQKIKDAYDPQNLSSNNIRAIQAVKALDDASYKFIQNLSSLETAKESLKNYRELANNFVFGSEGSNNLLTSNVNLAQEKVEKSLIQIRTSCSVIAYIKPEHANEAKSLIEDYNKLYSGTDERLDDASKEADATSKNHIDLEDASPEEDSPYSDTIQSSDNIELDDIGL